MKHIYTINEYVKNMDNTLYFVRRFINEFKKISNADIDSINQGSYENPTYVQIFIDNVIPKDTKRIEILLKKWKKLFEKEELLFSYIDRSSSNGSRFVYHYRITIKSDKVQRIKPPKYVYHTSIFSNRDKILKEGLKPISNKKWSYDLHYNPAIFASIDISELFLMDNTKDVWEINTEGLTNSWYVDLNLNTHGGYEHNKFIMTYNSIPKENIRLMDKNEIN